MKKTLSLILALLMTLSCASAIFADDDAAIADEAVIEEAIDVEEVAEETPYAEAIEFLAAYGIFKGYGNGDLGAMDDILRYQMALFTARVSTGWVDDEQWEDGPQNATEFVDLEGTPAAQYLGALSYVNQNGIIEGYGAGKFGPVDGITYQNALTMVVRTLGYQGLSWPWGYIEKAVNLGLTAGITGVAYTDTLTRGEVAQIIYNALFAETKAGDTLGARNFGLGFGWQTAIITASDNAHFIKNGENAKDGIVAFKVVNADGTLGDETYYANAAKTFGWDGKHDDELAVGKAFKVCFGVDGSLFYKSIELDTVWNLGVKNDDGKYPIQSYLDALTPVSTFTTSTYTTKNAAIAYKNEIILKQATYGTTYVTYKKGATDFKYAIDWTNGNILEYDAENKEYNAIWYYNELFEDFFKFKLDKDYKIGTSVDEVKFVGIQWMTDDDLADLKKDALKAREEIKTDLAFNTLDGKPATSAYASLEIFDFDGEGEADYGIYTSYRLGKISQATHNCGHKDCAFVDVSNLASKLADATYKEIEGKDNTVSYSVSVIKADSCGDCGVKKEIWWQDDFAPATDADGKVISNYVLYNYNKVTKELRVLATIDSKAAAEGETYYATGVLRSYSVDKQTLNIDGESFSFVYDELEGNMFAKKDQLTKNYATKAITSAYLRGLFNQFVEYVVVDGKVVFIEKKGTQDKNYIIVDDYAGTSNDGYIVVDGYSTTDLKYDQFRIGSYNGWEKGDAFYYLDTKAAQEYFTPGVVYAITSYDKEADLYFVQTISEPGELVPEEKVEAYEIKGVNVDKYVEDTKGDRKQKSADKYIIITGKEIYVYDGKLPYEGVGGALDTAYAVKGYKFTSAPDNTYIIFADEADVGTGFKGYQYDTGLVLFLKNNNVAMTYDGYDFDGEGYYLLGATVTSARVYNLYTGDDMTVTGRNVRLKDGNVYSVKSGKIENDIGVLTDVDKFAAVLDAYAADAKYSFAKVPYAAFTGFFNEKSEVVKDNVSKFVTKNAAGMSKEYKGLVDSVKIFVLEAKNDKIVAMDKYDSLKKIEKVLDEDSVYDILAMYNGQDDQDVVIYIFKNFAGSYSKNGGAAKVTVYNDAKATISDKQGRAYVDDEKIVAGVKAIKVNDADGFKAVAVDTISVEFEGKKPADLELDAYKAAGFFFEANDAMLEDVDDMILTYGKTADEADTYAYVAVPVEDKIITLENEMARKIAFENLGIELEVGVNYTFVITLAGGEATDATTATQPVQYIQFHVLVLADGSVDVGSISF